MRADTVRFVHECRMLDYETLISRIAELYEQFCELQAIIKANMETQTQMSRDYQSVVSKLEQVQLENTSLNRQLAHLAEQNLLKTREVFGSSCENLSKITQNSYDSVPDIDGHEMAAEETTGNPEGEIINFIRDCRKNSGERNKKEHKKADFSGLPQINRYTLDVEAMDRKYGPGRWYVMSWTKKWTLEKTSPVCYIKNTYMPNIVPYDDCRVPVSEGRINSLLSKSFASVSVVAGGMYDKYALAIPVYRQVLEYNRNGVPLSVQTLNGWINRFAAEYLGPVYDRLKEMMADIPYQQCDETTVQIIRDGRGASSKSYMWVHITSELYSAHRIVLFCFELTRQAEHLRKFYGEFDGFLTCDAYSAYRNFEKESDAKICGCFMHARRRFVEAFLVAHLKDMSEEQIKEHPSVQALLKILEIYRADEPLKKLTAEERLERRQSEVKPLVDAYFDYLRTLDMDDPSYGTKMKDAIKYSLNQECYLRQFLNDGNIPIDNGATERAIRPAAVGRRNWLFFGTVNGAQCGAIIYSLIETARACGANARYYLQYVLEKMPEHMDDTDRSFLDDMMPWSEAYRAYETSEMYNNLHLNLESEEEPPRKTYRKESMYLVS